MRDECAPVLGPELILLGFWRMLQAAMPEHEDVYRLGVFDVVFQGILHKSRLDVPELLSALEAEGYATGAKAVRAS